jgi:hypothetical protein
MPKGFIGILSSLQIDLLYKWADYKGRAVTQYIRPVGCIFKSDGECILCHFLTSSHKCEECKVCKKSFSLKDCPYELKDLLIMEEL